MAVLPDTLPPATAAAIRHRATALDHTAALPLLQRHRMTAVRTPVPRLPTAEVPMADLMDAVHRRLRMSGRRPLTVDPPGAALPHTAAADRVATPVADTPRPRRAAPAGGGGGGA